MAEELFEPVQAREQSASLELTVIEQMKLMVLYRFNEVFGMVSVVFPGCRALELDVGYLGMVSRGEYIKVRGSGGVADVTNPAPLSHVENGVLRRPNRSAIGATRIDMSMSLSSRSARRSLTVNR